MSLIHWDDRWSLMSPAGLAIMPVAAPLVDRPGVLYSMDLGSGLPRSVFLAVGIHHELPRANLEGRAIFGASMVDNAAAAEAFHEAFPGKIHRFVDCLDLVPLLPTVSLVANTYGRCHKEYELGNESNPEGGLANEVMKGMAASTIDGLLQATVIDEIWGQFHRRIASHMMANYQSQIAAKCQDR